ncbi:hypothetical protein J7E44_14030 [Chryseobacterium sp. ISL-6]|nr:hypothetical protein [Chryseobacterium sp. ISL-6]
MSSVIGFYLFCAYKSLGYLQEDEHYQIIEFANYKLGVVSYNGLAWEFKAMVRPGCQPLICYVIFKTVKSIGIADGYTLIFILRALTAILSVFIISSFIAVYKKYVTPSWKAIYIAASYLLWFLPYINIRFSSENLSGLMLVYSLVLLDKSNICRNTKLTILTGIVLGFSILFRFQSLLVILGMVPWLLLVRKAMLKNVLNLIFGIALVFILGVLIDYWLYGAWTISALRYFDVNILKGVASNFGTEPFYQYIIYILQAPGLFGAVILISFVIVLIYYPKNILVWMCVPFLIAHSIIPHKELRFLFPLINLCPLILVLGLQKTMAWLRKRVSHKICLIWWKVGILFFAIINIFGLYAISSTSASGGRFSVAAYIHKHYDKNKIQIRLVGSAYPFIDYDFLQTSYYSIKEYKKIDQAVNIYHKEVISRPASDGRKVLLILNANEIAGPKELLYLKSLGLKKVYQSIPDFTMFLYNFYNPKLKSQQTYIYQKVP